jgi:FixJ family two-component response regulator
MPTAPGVRIALVEDDAMVRRALARLLRTLGFSVTAFASAEELLATMARGGADCLLIDAHLPRVSGLELYQLLRRRSWLTPVIFVTADVDIARGDAMLQTGAPCFVKPVDDVELLAAITKLTANPR